MKNYWRQITEISQSVPRDEISQLLSTSNIRGWLAVGTTYGIIAFSFALVHFIPSILSVLIALILIGGRQLALAILTHEAVHKTLFSSKNTNEWVGKWLCANPMGIDHSQYRSEHLQHHHHTGALEDPDLGLVTPYPVSMGSMIRKYLRDLFGITGLKRIYYILQMGLGFLTYTLSTNAKPIDQSGRSSLEVIRTGIVNLHGILITNVFLFAILYLFGVPTLFSLWVGAYLSTFSVFLRIRSIAEHACTPDPANALLNSRTTHASPLARLTVAPHRVNYHLDHHLFMQIPYFNLPQLHALLNKQGIIQKGCTAQNYFEILLLTVKR